MSKVYINMQISGLVSANALATFMGQVEQETPHALGASALESATAEAPAEEKPKAERKRAEVKKNPAPEKEAPKVEEKQEEATDQASDLPTVDELKAVSQKLVAANGREAMAELLEEFGAKNLSSLPESQRVEYLEKANAKLAS